MHCCLWFRLVLRMRGPWPKCYGYHLSIYYFLKDDIPLIRLYCQSTTKPLKLIKNATISNTGCPTSVVCVVCVCVCVCVCVGVCVCVCGYTCTRTVILTACISALSWTMSVFSASLPSGEAVTNRAACVQGETVLIKGFTITLLFTV